jgi:hypothetical protein
MTTIKPRFVYQLHPAFGTYVPMHGVYGRIDGLGSFEHAGPHWMLSCPTDSFKFQTEVRTLDGWRTPWRHIGRKRPPNGTVVPYDKPGHTPFTAVRQSAKFEAELRCTDRVIVRQNAKDSMLHLAAATSPDRSYRIAWTGSQANLHWFDKRFIHGWRVGSIRRSSIRLGMIDVNFVAVNDPKHVLTIRDVSMGLPSNKDDYGLLSRWSITDQTGFNSSSEHPISLLMEGNAGEWLITNPATGSQFVGSGESDPPDGFFARS